MKTQPEHEPLMNKRKTDKMQSFLAMILSLVIALAAALAFRFHFLQNIENIAEDGLYQKPGMVSENIKIIGIDDATLERLGPYNEWDRRRFADLLGILNASEDTAPKVIGMDVLFSESSGTDAEKELVKNAAVYDNVVLATKLTFDRYIEKSEDGKYYSVQYISNEEKPFQELSEVSTLGFTNAIFDSDSFVRKAFTRLSSDYNGETTTYDSFAYQIALKSCETQYYNAQDENTDSGTNGEVTEYNKQDKNTDSVPSGEMADYNKQDENTDFVMPGEMTGFTEQVEIAYAGKPGDFEMISMADVLDGKVPDDYFKDCIVLVGAYADGLMDAYRVPIEHSRQMYGVELQANFVQAFLNNTVIHPVNENIQMLVTFLVVFGFSLLAFHKRIRNSAIVMGAIILSYFAFSWALFSLTFYKFSILYLPIGLVAAFLTAFLLRYFQMQRNRIREMRELLFSLAEAMAEAIEGRTPYNANHTKNVAKRCIKMLDFINEKHRRNETQLHFTTKDKYQLYLAAMLHDVGKMDVPLEIMDKATKLGAREQTLLDRLKVISLRIENDALRGLVSEEEAQKKISEIKEFTDKLGGFNCGRPLKDEEWQFVKEISGSVYVSADGEEIPYLTKEETDDLFIKAGTLSESERQIMQSHVVYTDKILSHIQFGEQFKDVRAMASNHHELLNGKGYPAGIGEKDLDVMTRILTIMDIYDSLIADDRPYKKPKPVPVAFEILDEEAEKGKVDKELLEYAKELYLYNKNGEDTKKESNS